jgi:hypothetical protein
MLDAAQFANGRIDELEEFLLIAVLRSTMGQVVWRGMHPFLPYRTRNFQPVRAGSQG